MNILTKKCNENRVHKKVNFLKINKPGGPNKVRRVGQNRKINKRGEIYLAPESTLFPQALGPDWVVAEAGSTRSQAGDR